MGECDMLMDKEQKENGSAFANAHRVDLLRPAWDSWLLRISQQCTAANLMKNLF